MSERQKGLDTGSNDAGNGLRRRCGPRAWWSIHVDLLRSIPPLARLSPLPSTERGSRLYRRLGTHGGRWSHPLLAGEITPSAAQTDQKNHTETLPTNMFKCLFLAGSSPDSVSGLELGMVARDNAACFVFPSRPANELCRSATVVLPIAVGRSPLWTRCEKRPSHSPSRAPRRGRNRG